jgi:succinate dehydrogenase / fumarate reductase, cytochrome b subunit
MQKTRPQDKSKHRPKNLNLFTIKLPINAVVSILHRVSGIGLFLSIPLVLLALQSLVHSEKSYLTLTSWLNTWFVKLMLIGLAWAFFHHFFAGIRHLLQDIHWMTSLNNARLSSRILLCLVALATVIFAAVIW